MKSRKLKRRSNKKTLVNVGLVQKRPELEVLNVNVNIHFVKNIDFLKIMNVISILNRKLNEN